MHGKKPSFQLNLCTSRNPERLVSKQIVKRFFLLLLGLWRLRANLYLSAALFGAFGGVFILDPLYDFVYFHEHNLQYPSNAGLYVWEQLQESLRGNTPQKTVFYAQIGIVLGLLLAWVYSALHNKLRRIEQFSEELDRNLRSIIQEGEGPLLEFKSSFRWDYVDSCINRNLEAAVLKTLAGYLNSSTGGTLLIGVNDHGEIIGLENDYQSFKKQNQDGFEQAVMTAVSTNLGADLCHQVKVLFHTLESKDVCRLIVLPSPRPVFLKQGKGPKFFLRTGGGTRDLNIQEATEFITDRWHK